MFVPVGAPMSTPEWKVEAPDVGAFRLPKGDVIVVQPGVGHGKALSAMMVENEEIIDGSNL